MNQLKVNRQHTIVSLFGQGWSKRRIARELDLDRATVRKYLAATTAKSPAHPQAGSVANHGPASLCDPWREQIAPAFAAGLSVQRIYQDLVVEHQFAGSCHVLRRFVLRQHGGAELPFRRMECEPGQELQVDFGQGAWVVENGKRRRPHLFRGVLSHSRKGYCEAVWRQTSESFIRSLENAFRHFGGVSATVVIDNLKAGVIQTDWFDPELNPKLEEFARHYGTAILPTKPAMPRHKGRVEAGVKYAQSNAVKGRSFASLAAQNVFLAEWEKNTAATHHGAWRLRDLKRLLELPGNVVQLDFLETHPLIRSLDAYRIEPKQTIHPPPTP